MVTMVDDDAPIHSPAQLPGSSSLTDPWERFGWVMSVIWLVFLAFPIRSALEQPAPRGVLGLAGILAFAGLYVYAFVRFPRCGTPLRTRTLALGALLALVVVTATTIGIQSIGLVPFIVAYATFHQPFARAIGITAGALVLTAMYISIEESWQDAWFIPAIIVLVAFSTGATRWIEIRQHHHNALSDEYRLVAERERVARDVHDVLGHSLTIITVKSELARRLIDIDPDRAAHEIEEIESISREALTEIRATVTGLRTARLDDELEHARNALTSAGIDYHGPDAPDLLEPRQREVAGWVVREAVTNVVRHSGASTCHIDVSQRRLTITDDGRGIPEPNGKVGGTGLHSIRERVETTGGAVSIGPGTDAGGMNRGTRVEVNW